MERILGKLAGEKRGSYSLKAHEDSILRRPAYFLIRSLSVILGATLLSGCSSSKKSGRSESSARLTEEPRIITTPSGLQYIDYNIGDGASPSPGQTVTVRYTGKLTDSTEFDNNMTGYSFIIGVGNVIRGWDEGIQTMKVGGRRKLIIPPELGYGQRGSRGVIPANATLVVEVELIRVR